MKTVLENRVLWYDGTNQISPDLVPEFILSGVKPERIIVSEMNEDIELFNSLSDTVIKSEKLKNLPFDMRWNIPQKYLDLDLDAYVKSICPADEQYKSRVTSELDEIRLRGLDKLFKTLIYIVDELKGTDTFWGVGRGSSCASLILFLIGLHKVDPVKYNIAQSEFFH